MYNIQLTVEQLGRKFLIMSQELAISMAYRNLAQLKEDCEHVIHWTQTDRGGGLCAICKSSFGPNHPDYPGMKEK